MKTQILNFINWLGSTLEEDNGKSSIKRCIALFLSLFYISAGSYIIYKDGITTDTISCLSTLAVTIFPFIAVLLGLSYIPSFTGNSRHQDAKTDNP